MNSLLLLLIVSTLVVATTAKVYFQENFDDGWEDRWVKSKNKQSDGTQGTWVWTAGKVFGDAQESMGIQTSPDARFHQISAALPESFSNRDKTLIIQYTVKHEQKLDCGGAYIKLLPKIDDQENYSGDTKYNIMFGPDQCGSTKKVHVIFNYNGKNHLIKDEIRPQTDQLTHIYTLIVKSDQTYQVLIDGDREKEGSFAKDWDFLPPKMIKDPTASKPKDWVDRAEIPDPEDTKPENYDDVVETITDPDANKPDDWDDELDGDWIAPQIPNPEYKGVWRPKMMPNPDYKGPWVHPEIENPDYYEDNDIYAYDDNSAVGFELWQVLSGTIFDNILVTDDEEYAGEQRKKIQVHQKTEKDLDKAHKDEEKKKKDSEKKDDKPEGDDFDFADMDAGHDGDDLHDEL